MHLLEKFDDDDLAGWTVVDEGTKNSPSLSTTNDVKR
jgi:hypothetical protein